MNNSVAHWAILAYTSCVSAAGSLLESCAWLVDMYESVVCEHMPHRRLQQKRTRQLTGISMLGKKIILFSQENGSVGRPETEKNLMWPMITLFVLIIATPYTEVDSHWEWLTVLQHGCYAGTCSAATSRTGPQKSHFDLVTSPASTDTPSICHHPN